MAKTLICTSNALHQGKVVKKGTVATYEDQEARRLLNSTRFAIHDGDAAADQGDAPDTVAELKTALDGLGIEHASKATKAELLELYQAAQDEAGEE